MFRKDFIFWQEILYLSVTIGIVYAFGFFDNQAGVIFLAFVLLFFLFYRLIRAAIYYRIVLVGMAIFVNGLLTFKYLQFSEMYLFNRSFQDKYESILTNTIIPIRLILPKEFYFHNPKDLKMKEKTGTGQIAGILSSGENNPNRYPLVRLFYVPEFIKADLETIKEEYNSILEFEKHQGNMEEIKNLGEHIHPEKKWQGNFWAFYDILRPRYSKTGFYIYHLKNGGFLILDITENLVENQFHENEIEEILKSIE